MKYTTTHYVCDCCGQEYDKEEMRSGLLLTIIPGHKQKCIPHMTISMAPSAGNGYRICNDCYYAIADTLIGKIREIRYGSDPQMAAEIYESKEETNI